jgi:hypothetical protein
LSVVGIRCMAKCTMYQEPALRKRQRSRAMCAALVACDAQLLWEGMMKLSQKDRITWARMAKLADDFLPKPTILHPWPSDRFAVTHPRWEPYTPPP